MLLAGIDDGVFFSRSALVDDPAVFDNDMTVRSVVWAERFLGSVVDLEGAIISTFCQRRVPIVRSLRRAGETRVRVVSYAVTLLSDGSIPAAFLRQCTTDLAMLLVARFAGAKETVRASHVAFPSPLARIEGALNRPLT